MSENNGGPAFPTPDKDNGMSLRDYFAAMAMQALTVASFSSVENSTVFNEMADEGKCSGQEAISALAYAQADAMLKERAK